jgi:hypothetical protein
MRQCSSDQGGGYLFTVSVGAFPVGLNYYSLMLPSVLLTAMADVTIDFVTDVTYDTVKRLKWASRYPLLPASLYTTTFTILHTPLLKSGRPAQKRSTITTRSISSSGTFDFARLVAPDDISEPPEPSRAWRSPFLTTPAVDPCEARPVATPTHVEPHRRPCNRDPYAPGSYAPPPSSSFFMPDPAVSALRESPRNASYGETSWTLYAPTRGFRPAARISIGGDNNAGHKDL